MWAAIGAIGASLLGSGSVLSAPATPFVPGGPVNVSVGGLTIGDTGGFSAAETAAGLAAVGAVVGLAVVAIRSVS